MLHSCIACMSTWTTRVKVSDSSAYAGTKRNVYHRSGRTSSSAGSTTADYAHASNPYSGRYEYAYARAQPRRPGEILLGMNLWHGGLCNVQQNCLYIGSFCQDPAAALCRRLLIMHTYTSMSWLIQLHTSQLFRQLDALILAPSTMTLSHRPHMPYSICVVLAAFAAAKPCSECSCIQRYLSCTPRS